MNEVQIFGICVQLRLFLFSFKYRQNKYSCTVTTDDGQRCCHCSFTNPYTVCPLGGWTAPSYSGGGPVRSNGVGTRKRF